jgi:hypothetical protein
MIFSQCSTPVVLIKKMLYGQEIEILHFVRTVVILGSACPEVI